MARIFLLLCLSLLLGAPTKPALAARLPDPALVAIHNVLLPARLGTQTTDPTGLRCAVPAMADAKRMLRDWIEAKLAKQSEEPDLTALEQGIHHDLEQANLIAPAFAQPEPDIPVPPPFCWGAGFVRGVKISRDGNVFYAPLILTTSMEIGGCGTDDSAYLYQWRDTRWQRLWQFEEPIDKAETYQPQQIDSVHISNPEATDMAHLVVSVGQSTWCTSRFGSVYYGLWRVNQDGSNARQLLMDTAEAIRIPDPAIAAAVTANDLLVEFRAYSPDPYYPSRQAVRHYRLDGITVIRDDPRALGPRNFISGWLTEDWQTAEASTAASGRADAGPWHERLKGGFVRFMQPTEHCTARPDLWLVGLMEGDNAKASDSRVYFLVRWTPPFRFDLVDVTAVPEKDCQEADPNADEILSLFSREPW